MTNTPAVNTYVINDAYGTYIDTVQAMDADAAFQAMYPLYGTDITIVRQYNTAASGFDPLWLLLALGAAMLVFKRKRS
jgi:hypothetical protein